MTTNLFDATVKGLLLAVMMVTLACSSGSTTTPNDTQQPEDVVAGDQSNIDSETDPSCVDEDDDGFFVGDGCREGSVPDCDDANALINPLAEEICGNGTDENCDDVDPSCEDLCEDLDKDGFLGTTDDCPKGNDCDDADNDIYPGATEVCGNDVDEDCDGSDEECPPECKDNDSDGFVGLTDECDSGTDCDDSDNDIYPGAVEICGNGVDEDCNDEDPECPPECQDGDGDGYGNGADCEGYDCNDGNPDVHPGAPEVCENGLDDDCVDGDAKCPETCDDNDEDGFGVGGSCVVQDCDDTDENIHPEAVEVCGNDIDENCDGLAAPCCVDDDGDGYGEGDCAGADCDDTNPDVNPDADEVCGNDIDENCDGEATECTINCEDADNDGFGEGADCAGSDCDDTNPDIYTGAQEICGNNVDEDCNGSDAECPPPDCDTSWDCNDDMLCDQSSGTCRFAKVWEWYAPTFYVDTDPGGEELDLIRKVNFDGDWNAQNNNSNLKSGDTDAVVYYSFVKTSTHWYLGYYVFFPKRWTSWPLGTKYDNTMRAVLVVVEQDGTQYGNPVLVETQTEDTFFQYMPAGVALTGKANKDGDINWDLFFPTDHHPVTYVHSQDHGIWGDAYLWNNIGNWDMDGFPGDDGVVYRFGNIAESPILDNDEVYYYLEPIKDSLWEKKGDVGAGMLFDEFGHFNFQDKTNYKSLAPWRIYDGNYPTEPEGELFWNPADFVRRQFNQGWGAFSYSYVYNPYVVKVTIKDLKVKAEGGFLDTDADPFVNITMADGGGFEVLVLSNFYGLQNNWYKDAVSNGSLLDMWEELGGRNFFYGFAYPGASYFGIEVRDYDGGWSGDDWLMDEEQTHYYDFTGQQLVDWEKSDSVLKVEAP
jgi:hypothetical protein